jgi:hypothetical protein
MSIGGWISHLIDEHRLYLIEAVFRGDNADRTLLISPEIHSLIEGPWPNEAWKARAAALRADLESFAAGGEISVCVEPRRAREEDLALLGPIEAGVWDWRSRKPSPGLRLVGQFVGKDTLVLLTPAMRSAKCNPSGFIRHGPLGDADSLQWRAIIAETTSLFRALFHPHAAVTGANLQDVLSSGYNPVGDGAP